MSELTHKKVLRLMNKHKKTLKWMIEHTQKVLKWIKLLLLWMG